MNRQLLLLKMAQITIQRLFRAGFLASFFTVFGLSWSHSWASAWSHPGPSWLLDVAVELWDRKSAQETKPKQVAEPAAPIAAQPPVPIDAPVKAAPVVDGWWV